ncbi:MAG: 16S rRNA (cytidine(1402)-2'-O)-methyltransferase [Candidatus Sedimenticola sp. 20ELBAFRAG]
MSIEKGILYIVPTPIGNRDDFSARSVEVLSQVDLIAAEDTRHSRPLLQHYGITTPLFAYHEHNERQAMGKILSRLEAGESVAVISDAGTPLISDPGFPLVRECHTQGIRVSPLPGPSAAVCALSAAGLPTDRFIFEGFPARTSQARQKQFQSLSKEPRTLVFYESSHRIKACINDMLGVFGEERLVVIARELTKLHETIISAPLARLVEILEQDANQQRGEFVVLVAGADKPDGDALDADTERLLRILVAEMPLKQAAAIGAKISGEKKNRLYKAALSWVGKEGGQPG